MELYEKVFGTLIGQAVGDALGFPFEGWPAEKITPYLDSLFKEFIPHPSGLFQPGQYTDDTQMMRATLVSIVEKKHVDPEDIAESYVDLWRHNQIVGQGQACRESIARLMNNEATWMDSGAEEGRAGNGAAMRIAPIGILNYNDPENLPWNVLMISRITHKDSRSCAGAVAVAATVAYNLRNRELNPELLIRTLVRSVEPINEELAIYISDLPRLIELDERQALDTISSLGLENKNISDYHVITPFVIPSVMVSLWSFLKSPEEYVECVGRVIAAGGDVDTTAAITGAFCGSLMGIHAVPAHMADMVNDRGKYGYKFFEIMAGRLVNEVHGKKIAQG